MEGAAPDPDNAEGLTGYSGQTFSVNETEPRGGAAKRRP